MIQLSPLGMHDWWPHSPSFRDEACLHGSVEMSGGGTVSQLWSIGLDPTTMSSDSSLAHGPSPDPCPRMMNDLRPVETDGTVWGKQNALPRRCQNPILLG